jgi:hypothetical protein
LPAASGVERFVRITGLGRIHVHILHRGASFFSFGTSFRVDIYIRRMFQCMYA